jgi:hypothetical protein
VNITLNVKQKIRRDTEENWESKNPILLDGEQGYVTSGTHKGMFKVGDGGSTWTSLDWSKAVANGGEADTLGGKSVSEVTDAENITFDRSGTTTNVETFLNDMDGFLSMVYGQYDIISHDVSDLKGKVNTNEENIATNTKNIAANAEAIPTKASQLTFENSDNSETNLQTFLAQQKLALDAIYQSEGNLENRVEQNETNISTNTNDIKEINEALANIGNIGDINELYDIDATLKEIVEGTE